MAFAQALFEGVVQGLAGQAFFAVLQVTFHDLFVDLDHLVDDALVRVGHRAQVGVADGVEETVDYPRALVGRQVDRQAFGAEGFAQFFEQHR